MNLTDEQKHMIGKLRLRAHLKNEETKAWWCRAGAKLHIAAKEIAPERTGATHDTMVARMLGDLVLDFAPDGGKILALLDDNGVDATDHKAVVAACHEYWGPCVLDECEHNVH